MRRTICALIVLALSGAVPLIPAPAYAQDKAEQVEDLSRSGTKKYRAKDYEGAIEDFKKAHAIEPVPNLLFNIAKCYEKIEDWDNAIDYYQQFVVEDVDKKSRKIAMGRIDSLNEIKAAQAKVDTEKDQKDDPKEEIKKEEDPVVVDNGSDLTWAYVTLGSGAALVAGGAVFGLLASQKQTDFEQATSTQDKVDARDSGETMALVADSFYVAGAILAGVGVVLLLTADDGEGEGVAASTFGWFDGDGGGIGVHASF